MSAALYLLLSTLGAVANYTTTTDDAKSTAAASCSSAEFQCGSGRCIPRSLVCDHFNNCGDFSDEERCDASCTNSSFLCENGRCIPGIWRCDGRNDCHDASDELNCDSCRGHSFRCGDGECINDIWICDRDDDCNDGSDEHNCSTSIENTSPPATEVPSAPTTVELQTLASTEPQCLPGYCQNGGQCDIVRAFIICTCISGYAGDRCQVNLGYNSSESTRTITISISTVALAFSVLSLALWIFRSRVFRDKISTGTRKFVVYLRQFSNGGNKKLLTDSDDCVYL